jgi:hypothetical protein
MHQQFNIQQLYVLPPHTVFMSFVFIWEQTATCATYIISWLVFITQMKSFYCAVRTVSLNKAVCAFIWEQTVTCATYIISWLVFITQMKSFYCAVRTGSLNKAVCASYLKGYLRTNSDLCHLQHKLNGFYTPDEKCLLRGTNWVFK